MLNFTTLHFSKFRNAKLQKKVDLCNSGKSTQKTKMQKTQIRNGVFLFSFSHLNDLCKDTKTHTKNFTI